MTSRIIKSKSLARLLSVTNFLSETDFCPCVGTRMRCRKTSKKALISRKVKVPCGVGDGVPLPEVRKSWLTAPASGVCGDPHSWFE